MIKRFILNTTVFLLFSNIAICDEIDQLLQKALDAKFSEVGNDSSARQRYLFEILQKEPDHLEALWQVTLIKLNSIPSSSLSKEAPYLAMLGPEVNKILDTAISKGNRAFYHYINAVYASAHKAYDTALIEIEKSINLEPQSARYVLNKGKILIDKGRWTYNDDNIAQGLDMIEAALILSKQNKNPFHSPWHYNFQLALGNSYFENPKWQEVISNYQISIDIMEKVNAKQKSSYAYAWRNMSTAYRKIGDCTNALKSADKALEVMDFKAAQYAKSTAELCIEMQKMVDKDIVKSK